MDWSWPPPTGGPLGVAVLVGVASAPFTVWLSGGSEAAVTRIGVTAAGEPLFVAGLLVGLAAAGKWRQNARTGVWTGVAGSIGPLVLLGSNLWGLVGTGSVPAAVLALAAPLLAALAVGISAAVGATGATIGGGIGRRVGRLRGAPRTK